MDPRDALIPEITEKHREIVRRIYGRGIAPQVHQDSLRDVAFLDLEALCRAGYIERLTQGRFRGYRVTGKGLGWLGCPPA